MGGFDKTVSSSEEWLRAGRSALDPAATTDPLTEGTRVGRYEIERLLGEGGMGTVYLAHDPELQRRVALKRVHASVAADDAAQSRLLREARAMARLAHPNVVTVYDLLVHEGHIVVAMELVDGETLRTWRSRAPRTWREVVAHYVEAGRGLAAAHAVGLVHRDFKPDNVLVSTEGRVRVTDFGLARPAGETAEARAARRTDADAAALAATLTLGGQLVGTPAYMAPEQHRGQADARSDQFAFSVALYEALASDLPFPGETWAELRRAVESGTRRPLPASAAPAWIQRIVERGLAADPDARFASMNELLAALVADPAARRRRVFALATGAVVATSIVAFGFVEARARAQRACSSAEAQLDGVWDGAARREMNDSFAATGKPFANDAFRVAATALDGYAGAWKKGHTDACEATRLRGEQSAELMDLRMACYAERREELKSAVSLLRHADAAMVSKAVSVSQSLGGLDRCANVRQLRAVPEPPEGQRARVQALRADLARARTLLSAGKFDEAAKSARVIAAEANGMGFAPLESEALVEVGWTQWSNGDADAAEKTLYQAAWIADAAGDDLDRAWAWTALLYDFAYVAKKKEGASVIREQAIAAAKRVAGESDLQASLSGVLGALALDQQRYEDARVAYEKQLALHEAAHGKDCVHAYVPYTNIGLSYARQHDTARSLEAYTRALAVTEKVNGPNATDTALVVGQIGALKDDAGSYAEAEALQRRAVSIVEQMLGPEHPALAIHLGNLARALSNEDRYAEAAAAAERALSIREKALGATHMKLIYPLLALSEAYAGLGRWAEAIALTERALRLDITTSVGFARAELKFVLARALDATGRDKARALALANEAKVELGASAGSSRDQRLLGRIDEWLRVRAPLARARL